MGKDDSEMPFNEKVKEMVNEAVSSQLRPLLEQLVANNGHKHKEEEIETYDAKPYKPGKFVVQPITDNLEEVYCPTCGTFERRPKAVVQKEVVKEVIPKGYVPAPQGLEDIIPYLEMKHTDGKSIFECPTCSKAFDTWLDKHVDDIKKQGYEVRKVRH